MAVMIGIDPHKGSHTAAAIDPAEVGSGRSESGPSAEQVERLLAWADRWPDRIWAVENAGGLGYLLAQQLIAAGERVLMSRPSWPPGFGCSTPGTRTRTTPTTPARSPSPRCAHRRMRPSRPRTTRR